MTKEFAELAQKHLNGFNLAKGDTSEQGNFLRATLRDDELRVDAELLVADQDAWEILLREFTKRHPNKILAEPNMDVIKARIARQINLARKSAIEGSLQFGRV